MVSTPQTNRTALTIGVLSGDPTLPYAYGVDGRFPEADVAAAERVVAAVNTLDGYVAEPFNDHSTLIGTLRSQPPDLALNFCDGGYRNLLANAANIPALLELLDIPFTGSDAAAMHSGDKAMMRMAAAAMGVPVPDELLVNLQADFQLSWQNYPAIIKPNLGYGSASISPDSVVYDSAEAETYLRRLATETAWTSAVIQEYLTGAEYTIGLIGNPDSEFTVLGPLEIDFSGLPPGLPPILTYGSKADPDSPYWQALQFKPAVLGEQMRWVMVEHAKALFERLGFRDYARIDFRAGADGTPRFIDGNCNPTWTDDGKMAIMAEWAGYDYTQFLGLILAAARHRYGL